MNIALWILQILLAAAFLTLGSIKLVLPKDKISKVFEWIDDFSRNKVKIIGISEILGAFGLFLPGVYSLWNIIIPLSATGLAIIMVLAALTHHKRGEKIEMVTNAVFFFLLLIVIFGRFIF